MLGMQGVIMEITARKWLVRAWGGHSMLQGCGPPEVDRMQELWGNHPWTPRSGQVETKSKHSGR